MARLRVGIAHGPDDAAPHGTRPKSFRKSDVQEIARVLKVILLEPERRQIERKYTDNFKAFDLYLKGRDAWNTFTREGLRQGIVYFKQAIEEDRNYTLAYSGLADCYTILLAALHEPPQDVLPDAKRYAEIVEKRAPDLAQAQVSLGMYYLFAGLNWEKARAHLTRAVTLKPRYADAHHFLAHYFESQGKFEDAKKEWDLAREFDRLSNMIAAELGQTYLFAGDYPRAVALCREAVEEDSEFLFGLQVLGAALTFTGDYTNAIQTLQRAQALKEGDWPLFIAELAKSRYSLNGMRPLIGLTATLRGSGLSMSSGKTSRFGMTLST